MRLSYIIERLGVPLASKDGSSKTNDAQELTDILVAFEQINKCKITLEAHVELHKGYLDMKWTATAVENSQSTAVPTSSASQSVTVWAGDYKTQMAVVTRLLYAMDFQLALNEFEKAGHKKA